MNLLRWDIAGMTVVPALGIPHTTKVYHNLMKSLRINKGLLSVQRTPSFDLSVCELCLSWWEVEVLLVQQLQLLPNLIQLVLLTAYFNSLIPTQLKSSIQQHHHKFCTHSHSTSSIQLLIKYRLPQRPANCAGWLVNKSNQFTVTKSNDHINTF